MSRMIERNIKELKIKQAKERNEELRKCATEGISCDYGICDECPVTAGLLYKSRRNEK